MTRIEWVGPVQVGPVEDPCRFRHQWQPAYRWVWGRWWFRRRFYEQCWDCEATRGR